MADHGLWEAAIGFNLQNVEFILENIVVPKLLRRGYKVCVGRVGDKEIDFVGEKDGDKLYVQVCRMLNRLFKGKFHLFWKSKTTIPRLFFTRIARSREIMRGFLPLT